MNFYAALSRLPRPQSYIGKFLIVAFIGVHVPLLTLVGYIAASKGSWEAALPLLLVALVATLLGTIATLVVQGKLLAPVLETSNALSNYVRDQNLPTLPTYFVDEAGVLMANAQHCLTNLDALLKLKNNFLAILSHDVRSPISAIILASDLLKIQLDSPQIDKAHAQKMLDRIIASAYYQLDLMNNILTFARADSGVIEVHPTPITIQTLLDIVSVNASLQAQAKGIQLAITAEAPPETEVMIDSDKTVQIINNLLHNALKFTRADGKVSLTTRCTDTEVEFSVQDTGVGIDEEVQEQLFQRFSGGQRRGTRNESGSGLGLWICKTFTEIQGGSIAVYSKVGEGTRFTVRIPRNVQPRKSRILALQE